MASTPVISKSLAELFESGVSILVGTRSASFLPLATRGCGATVDPDRQRLTVFLPEAVAACAIANLKDNGAIAVGFSSVLDHKTIQVKGRFESTRPATDAERDIIVRYHAAFAEMLSFTGIPRATSRRLNVWPCVAVTFVVTDVFQQTPGPGAGERLGAEG